MSSAARDGRSRFREEKREGKRQKKSVISEEAIGD